jgi:HAD superfamily phosphoserine phosphatase-like hydrolase
MQGLLLAGAGRDEMEAHVGRFLKRLLAGGLRPGALAKIAEHKAAGHRLVMATASMDYYAAPIGALLGFDLVVATRSTRDGAGHLAAAIEGENCYGMPKLDMLRLALAGALEGDGGAGERPRIVAYSDHVSDLPLLDWADEAVAVNPSPALRRGAAERGFSIVDWG